MLCHEAGRKPGRQTKMAALVRRVVESQARVVAVERVESLRRGRTESMGRALKVKARRVATAEGADLAKPFATPLIPVVVTLRHGRGARL